MKKRREREVRVLGGGHRAQLAASTCQDPFASGAGLYGQLPQALSSAAMGAGCTTDAAGAQLA